MDIITLNHRHAGASIFNEVSLDSRFLRMGDWFSFCELKRMAGKSVFLAVTYNFLQPLRPQVNLISKLHVGVMDIQPAGLPRNTGLVLTAHRSQKHCWTFSLGGMGSGAHQVQAKASSPQDLSPHGCRYGHRRFPICDRCWDPRWFSVVDGCRFTLHDNVILLTILGSAVFFRTSDGGFH